jgi:hypothetical protein
MSYYQNPCKIKSKLFHTAQIKEDDWRKGGGQKIKQNQKTEAKPWLRIYAKRKLVLQKTTQCSKAYLIVGYGTAVLESNVAQEHALKSTNN